MALDAAAIDAGWDLVKLLGRPEARKLLEVLELPDDNRPAFISSMYLRDDGQALAEVLADVEEDLTGRTRERLIAGLHAALDQGER
jgi:hypothetical protein